MDIIHPSVRPIEGEVVVGKHRVNALYGTGLDVALRANDIHDLVIFGYATSGVVLSTVRYGADLDYNLIEVTRSQRNKLKNTPRRRNQFIWKLKWEKFSSFITFCCINQGLTKQINLVVDSAFVT